MRNAKFQEVKPNYRKNVLEIILLEGKRRSRYQLPFAVFRGQEIGTKNRFSKLEIDKELASQAVSYELENGTRGDFPSDFVLYYCDSSYNWSPINQLKHALKDKLAHCNLSCRVLADALDTSPAQVMRLLEENQASKQLLQLVQLAELAGYSIEFNLKKKKSA